MAQFTIRAFSPILLERASCAERSDEAVKSESQELALPLERLTAADLHDSFNEMRNGHLHEAIDNVKPRGTLVLAVTEGEIEKLFPSKAGGNTIYLYSMMPKHIAITMQYLDHYADGLHERMHVARGAVIGYVGSTGNSSPSTPHLHFAIYRLGSKALWWRGLPVDPYPILMAILTGR